MHMEAFILFPLFLTSKFIFLPLNTTSKFQPLDVEIIESVKIKYRWWHLERTVDLADIGVNDFCKIDILCAMRWLSSA